jgi:3-hydroxyacyl-[acyl-carrier protein] dehydratase / trans-2-decenoyl-[acyl-carrier protein] isomerase
MTSSSLHQKKDHYTFEELLKCGQGELFGAGNAQLPIPPMLMMDRITHISDQGGEYAKGQVVAEYEITADRWFFGCHFVGDPVMPGCLGLDALWQLTGFFLGWTGAPGRGRALGVGEVKFSKMITPENKLIRYIVDLKRVINRKLVLAIADGQLEVDGEVIYTVKDMRVGLFQDTQ